MKLAGRFQMISTALASITATGTPQPGHAGAAAVPRTPSEGSEPRTPSVAAAPSSGGCGLAPGTHIGHSKVFTSRKTAPSERLTPNRWTAPAGPPDTEVFDAPQRVAQCDQAAMLGRGVGRSPDISSRPCRG